MKHVQLKHGTAHVSKDIKPETLTALDEMMEAARNQMTKEVKPRPILFSTAMVKAILLGVKTQTRRVMKPQLPADLTDLERGKSIFTPGGMLSIRGRANGEYGEWFRKPLGFNGHRLWVRETHYRYGYWRKDGLTKQGRQRWRFIAVHESRIPEQFEKVYYEATSRPPAVLTKRSAKRGWYKRPSIFLPYALARIVNEITDVRVERLQEITEADALAEGFTQELCAEVFGKAAGKLQRSSCYWFEHDETGEEDSGDNGNYCHGCAQARRKRLGKKWRLRGDGGSAQESDGPAYCSCGTPFWMSLTKYGIERELYLECDDGKSAPRYPVSGMDASIVQMIADGIGDLRDEHLGRLAQIGFATGWNGINGRRDGGSYAWKQNPYIWVVSFKRIQPK